MDQSMPDMGTTPEQEAPLPIQPQSPTQPVKAHVPRVPLIAGGVIIFGLIILFVVSKLLSTPNDSTVQVVETPTPTPTPVRILSAAATQSAFLSLEQTHASLSATLVSINLDDPSLSPPVLDLPLGFRK